MNSFLLLISFILKILNIIQNKIKVVIEIIIKYVNSKIFLKKFEVDIKSKNEIKYSIPCTTFNDITNTKNNFKKLLRNNKSIVH